MIYYLVAVSLSNPITYSFLCFFLHLLVTIHPAHRMVSLNECILYSIAISLFIYNQLHNAPLPPIPISLGSAASESTRYQFDVFLGFRDLKAPLAFTDHLAKALVQAGIRIFRDDHGVEPGDHVNSEIRKAISNSSVYVLVISSAHVSPVFLDELVLMVEQRKASDHLVIPIFYHVHPSVAKCQTGPFSPSFLHLEKDLEVSRILRNEAIILAADPRELFPFHLSDDVVDKLQEQLLQQASLHKKEAEDISQQLFRWKEALHDIAGIKPVHVDKDSHESETVKLIVGRVVKHIATKQSLSKALLGISQ